MNEGFKIEGRARPLIKVIHRARPWIKHAAVALLLLHAPGIVSSGHGQPGQPRDPSVQGPHEDSPDLVREAVKRAGASVASGGRHPSGSEELPCEGRRTNSDSVALLIARCEWSLTLSSSAAEEMANRIRHEWQDVIRLTVPAVLSFASQENALAPPGKKVVNVSGCVRRGELPCVNLFASWTPAKGINGKKKTKYRVAVVVSAVIPD
jgi:hypothetical protein